MKMNETITPEEISEDDVEIMAEHERLRRRNGGFADIASFQTIICLLSALGILILLRFAPAIAGELIDRICSLSKEKTDIFPNPLIYFVR